MKLSTMRVGRHLGVRIADALAEIERSDQRRDAAGDVDHGAAGEVAAMGSAPPLAFSRPPTPQTMCAIGQ